VARTPRGRVATARAFSHLALDPPADAADAATSRRLF
jgi:hypothetical protein